MKQCKEKLVTTDTNQTITGFKAFNNGSGNNRTNIDIITDEDVGNDEYNRWAGSLQFKKGDSFVGHFEALKTSQGSVAQMVAHNIVNGENAYANITSVMADNGVAYATAPVTPKNTQYNTILTKNVHADPQGDNLPIRIIADGTNQQQTPTTDIRCGVVFLENETHTKGDGITSWVYGERLVNGQTGTYLVVRRFLDSDTTETVSFLGVYIGADGKPFAYAPTPQSTASNSGDVVTTAWFNQKMQVVSALPASPDPNVFYFIPE